MLTSVRGLKAATFLAGGALFATPALANETVAEVDSADDAAVEAAIAIVAETEAEIAAPVILPIEGEVIVTRASEPAVESESKLGGESGFELSGNVALVTDYRFRGVSFSDGDIALQGGIDLGHESGFYIGTWASTISGGTDFGELELDIYGGWSGDISDGVTFDIGLLYYIYPTGDAPGVDTDYFEPYASISTTLGPASATLGVAYAWDQASLGDDDNLYIYTDFEVGIPETPVTLSAHLGYTDGVFATDFSGNSFDWGLGASYAVTDSLSLGVNYVDTEGPSIEDFTDTGFYFTLAYSM
ncbi:TorF family putative porin [Erythrobacter sp. HKB08]|uniref:TorF family putative porin n=1 Tax=Erythrobacter sp. HKB08 TaxID=2502843 RepID=UPI001008F868|nr:TorF family putative porin [Erythrobacter sp. HKB08]